jgi:hypothetical protein
MSRIEELFQDIAEEFARGNRQEREYSRSEIDTSDLIKDDALLLEGLAMAATAPVLGVASTAAMTPKWLAPYIGRASTYGISPSVKSVSNARVGTDVVGRAPMPVSKTPAPTVRGPRGNTNIDQPVQRNLDLSDLKPTGIQNTTQARGMNPRMRKDLETRQRTIDAELYDLDRRSKDGMEIDLDKVMRLRDELTALTKTLTD